MKSVQTPSIHEDSKDAHRWIASLVLCGVGVLGVVYLQTFAFSWRMAGMPAPDRRTLGVVLLLLSLGALWGKGESFSWRAIRRWMLCCAIGSVTVFHVYWRAGGEIGVWFWLPFLLSGLSAGAELPWLFRGLRTSVDYDPKRRLLYSTYAVASLVLPSICVPYTGVLLSCVVYTGCILLWTVWESNTSTHSSRRGFVLGFTCAFCIGMWMSSPVLFLSSKGYLPVDSNRSKNTDTTLYLETLSSLNQWLVREGRWEFLSADAHRWSESLIHPAMANTPRAATVLLLGGESGFAAREILRYPNVKRVDIWTHRAHRAQFFQRQPILARLNQKSLQDQRVHLFTYADRRSLVRALSISKGRYDRIFVASERPWVESKWAPTYTKWFSILKEKLRSRGTLGLLWGELIPVSSYACVLHAMRRAGWSVRPYRSLGTGIVWGLALARKDDFPVSIPSIPAGLQYLNPVRMSALFRFPPEHHPARHPTSDCIE